MGLNAETIIAISAVLFATVGWLWNGRLQRSTDRRKHTYSIIALQQDDELYRSAIILLRKIGLQGLSKAGAAKLPQRDIDKLDHILITTSSWQRQFGVVMLTKS